MEFKGLRVLESWNRTRKLWVLKIAILSPNLVPQIWIQHCWEKSLPSLPGTLEKLPGCTLILLYLYIPLNTWHQRRCISEEIPRASFVCVCVFWKGTGCLIGLILQLQAVNFYGISEFFLVGGEKGQSGWGRERKNYLRAEFFERGGTDDWVQVLHCESTLSPK